MQAAYFHALWDGQWRICECLCCAPHRWLCSWVRHNKGKKLMQALAGIVDHTFDKRDILVQYLEDYGTQVCVLYCKLTLSIVLGGPDARPAGGIFHLRTFITRPTPSPPPPLHCLTAPDLLPVQYQDSLSRQVFHINSSDEHGNTLLIVACQNGHQSIVNLLIRKGANPNHQNKAGCVPCCGWCGRGGPVRPPQLRTVGGDGGAAPAVAPTTSCVRSLPALFGCVLVQVHRTSLRHGVWVLRYVCVGRPMRVISFLLLPSFPPHPAALHVASIWHLARVTGWCRCPQEHRRTDAPRELVCFCCALAGTDLGAWLADPSKGGAADDVLNKNGLGPYDGLG